MKQQGDYHAAGTVLPHYSIEEIQKNDPKPLNEKAKAEEQPTAPKKAGVPYAAKTGSSFVPSRESAMAISLEDSKMGSIPAQSMNPKYQAVPLDVAGEKGAARPAWQQQVPKLDMDKVLESKSVGKPRNPKPAPPMPAQPPLEPVKKYQESI